MSVLNYERYGDVAVLTMANPPVNALAFPMRLALVQALERVAHDGLVQAAVLIGAGKFFCGGANIADFDSDGLAEPSLHHAINGMLDASAKPVVAAIHGAAMGGGLELALACHYRICRADAKLALPEITLGFIPGAGGTQRLPRAVGLEPALNMILSGKTVLAQEMQDTALVDALVPDGQDLLAVAVEFARSIRAQRPLPRLRDRRVEHADAAALLQFARRAAQADRQRLPGALVAIDAIDKAVHQPFDAGVGFELASFLALAPTEPARALRHGFMARSEARKLPGLDAPTAAPRLLERAVVIGAGLMGSGIAICLADAGLQVTLVDTAEAGLERGRASVAAHYAGLVKRGRLDATRAAEHAQRIAFSLNDDAMGRADLVIEAVFEEQTVKAAVIRRMDAKARPGALLASNTSSLDLNQLAALTGRPHDVVGLHFFSPATVMPLVEVVRGRQTSDATLSDAMALVQRLRKTAVVAGVCDGFIGNRMLDEYCRQAFYLLEEGALPEQVDAALESWGMAMGPFRMLDMVGNDVPWAVRKRRHAEQPQRPNPTVADALCERGWFGHKSGRGWYRNVPGEKRPQPDPEVRILIEAHSAQRGVQRRAIGNDEIVQRCVLALVNEGARVLGEGIALRGSDIDLAMQLGYGFPAQHGGPMFHADQLGLHNVLRLLRSHVQQAATHPHGDAAFWQPAPLIERLAAGQQCLSQHSYEGVAA